MVAVSVLISIGALLMLKRFWLSLAVGVAASFLIGGVALPVLLTHPVVPFGPGYFPTVGLVSTACFLLVWCVWAAYRRVAHREMAASRTQEKTDYRPRT